MLGGGAAGGGKSIALLFDPLFTQAVIEHARWSGQLLDQMPPAMAELCRKYPIRKGESEGHALHMRRTTPQLRETIDRSLRMIPKFDPGAVWQAEPQRWVLSSGYKLTFGHCIDEKATENYLSNQYTWLGLDEACQFTERQYEELSGRVRSADPVLRLLLRIRLMSNPAPGWLKERFVDPAPEGGTLLKRKIIDPVTGETQTRTLLFLPAKLEDNPDREFAHKYKFELLSKPAHMRARYLYGDWNSMEGGFFEDDYNPAVHDVDDFKIPRQWPKFRSMDWGFKAPGTIGWFAIDPDDNLYQFYEMNFRLMRDEEVAKRVVEIEQQMGFWNHRERRSRLGGVADTQLWEERGDSGQSKAAVFAEHGIYWQPADKASIARNAERVVARLRDHDGRKQPGLVLFKGCRKSREMFASIAVDPNDSTIPDKKSPLKHWFDMHGYAAAFASGGAESLYMEPHDFDRPDEEPDDLPQASGFGYGY